MSCAIAVWGEMKRVNRPWKAYRSSLWLLAYVLLTETDVNQFQGSRLVIIIDHHACH